MLNVEFPTSLKIQHRSFIIQHSQLPAALLSYHAVFFRSNGTSCNQACGARRQDDVERDYLPEDPRTRAGAAVPRCLEPTFMVGRTQPFEQTADRITYVIGTAPGTDLPANVSAPGQ